MDLIPVISLLFALAVTLLVMRVATVALTLTGLSREASRFQARSALTGVGFTSSESEKVINHPVRRRIIMFLMLLGNAGIVTMVATLMASLLATQRGSNVLSNLVVLLCGLLVLTLLASSRWIDRRMSRLIELMLRRWTRLDVYDYAALFRLSDGYAVCEIRVDLADWLANKTLAALRLASEGVLVLGIQRADGMYVGAPKAETVILPNDVLVVYGPSRRIRELDRRRSGLEGAVAHQKAIKELERVAS